MDDASTSPESQVIGGYPVIKAVGDPAEGLFLARDEAHGRTVTLKLLSLPAPADPVGVVDFVDRARTATRLSSRHLLEVYDFVQHEERWFAVLEPLHGESVKARSAHAPFSVVKGSKLVGQAIEALSVIHAAGRAHGAVTTTNLFLVGREGGGAELLKLLDFGAASGQSEIVEFSSLAPEQKGSGDPTPPSDVWGLGTVLFELLEGRPPHEARRLGANARSGEPIPEALAVVVNRTLENEPRSRFSSLDTLSAAIAHAVGLGPQPQPTDTSIANLKAVTSARAAAQALVVAPIAQVQMPAITPAGRAAIATSEIPRPRPRRRSPWLLVLPMLLVLAAGVRWLSQEADVEPVIEQQAALPAAAPEPAPVEPAAPAVDPMLSANAATKMQAGARRVAASVLKAAKPARAAAKKVAKKKKR